jgi:hypothetical protein
LIYMAGVISIAAARILVGALLLVLGRRLFWLFVGAVGFVGGIRFADHFLQGYPDETVILLSVILGVICMALAVMVKKMALGAAGFLAGGYLLLRLTTIQPIEPFTQYPLLAFMAGGVVGALFISTVFNLTLIVLSSLGGAALICESLNFDPKLSAITFTTLAIAGVMAQAGLLHRPRGGD